MKHFESMNYFELQEWLLRQKLFTLISGAMKAMEVTELSLYNYEIYDFRRGRFNNISVEKDSGALVVSLEYKEYEITEDLVDADIYPLLKIINVMRNDLKFKYYIELQEYKEEINEK